MTLIFRGAHFWHSTISRYGTSIFIYFPNNSRFQPFYRHLDRVSTLRAYRAPWPWRMRSYWKALFAVSCISCAACSACSVDRVRNSRQHRKNVLPLALASSVVYTFLNLTSSVSLSEFELTMIVVSAWKYCRVHALAHDRPRPHLPHYRRDSNNSRSMRKIFIFRELIQ